MSLNPCIKTGANVWIDSHGAALHGDLYHVAGVYVLRYIGKLDFVTFALNCDAIFRVDGAEQTASRMGDFPPLYLEMNPFRSDCGTILIEESFVQTELD